MWNDSETKVPFSFSLPIPQTSYTTGTMNVWSGGQYAYGNYSGTTTTTTMQTYHGTRTQWSVAFVVFPVEEPQPGKIQFGTLIFSSTAVNRWRWSKPDKDALEECLKFLAKGGPVGLK